MRRKLLETARERGIVISPGKTVVSRKVRDGKKPFAYAATEAAAAPVTE